MTPEDIRGHLATKLGADVEGSSDELKGDPFAVVPVERWNEACRIARHDDQLSLTHLRSLCGVDWPEEGVIEVVAHLYSYKHRHAFVLKTKAKRDEPKVMSVCDVWPAAVWHERETYDLMGVEFTGNPDLRRILLPDDWEGHPLRKDYQEKDDYNGIPTSRPGYEKADEVQK